MVKLVYLAIDGTIDKSCGHATELNHRWRTLTMLETLSYVESFLSCEASTKMKLQLLKIFHVMLSHLGKPAKIFMVGFL
jgi:hypothetical protein